MAERCSAGSRVFFPPGRCNGCRPVPGPKESVMKKAVTCWVLILSALLAFASPAVCDDSDEEDTVVMVTDFSYKIRGGESAEISRALALFGASEKAVDLAAKYLSRHGVLEPYGKRRKEIYLLAAETIDITVLEERTAGNAYFIKIRTRVKSTDFIQAEIRNLAMEKEERAFSYRQEMDQPLMAGIAPGRELSRAYRYFRLGQWRLGVIYLDHLEKKYPHWGDLFLAKAIGYYSLCDTEEMTDALKKACELDNPEACDDLQRLVQVHGKDLNLQ
jgi:hypothetical protein